MRTLSRAAAVFLAAWAISPGRAEAGYATYDFDSSPLYTTYTPFSLTDSGTTATFSTPAAGAGGSFGVQNAVNLVAPMSGHYLGDNGVSPSANIALDVTFTVGASAASLYDVRFDFVTGDLQPGNTPGAVITVTAYEGASLVGSASTSGVSPHPYTSFPQGSLELGTGSVPFDRIEITSAAPSFGIDNLRVANSVPEPASALLIVVGGASALASRRRGRLA